MSYLIDSKIVPFENYHGCSDQFDILDCFSAWYEEWTNLQEFITVKGFDDILLLNITSAHFDQIVFFECSNKRIEHRADTQSVIYDFVQFLGISNTRKLSIWDDTDNIDLFVEI